MVHGEYLQRILSYRPTFTLFPMLLGLGDPWDPCLQRFNRTSSLHRTARIFRVTRVYYALLCIIATSRRRLGLRIRNLLKVSVLQCAFAVMYWTEFSQSQGWSFCGLQVHQSHWRNRFLQHLWLKVLKCLVERYLWEKPIRNLVNYSSWIISQRLARSDMQLIKQKLLLLGMQHHQIQNKFASGTFYIHLFHLISGMLVENGKHLGTPWFVTHTDCPDWKAGASHVSTTRQGSHLADFSNQAFRGLRLGTAWKHVESTESVGMTSTSET